MRSSFLKNFAHSLLASALGLFVGCLAAAVIISFAHIVLESSDIAEAFLIGFFMSAVAFLYGSIPALTYGTLAYALLLYFHRAGYLSALASSLVPGVVLLVLILQGFHANPGFFVIDSPEFALIFLGYSALVGLATHASHQFYMRWLSRRRFSIAESRDSTKTP